MNKVCILRVALLICLFGVSISAIAQQYDPFDGRAADFHVKFERYFKTRDVETASRKVLFDSTAAYRRDSVWSLGNLRAHLDKYESLLVSLQRHNQYFRLLCYVNKKDTAAQQAYQQIDDTLSLVENITGRLLLQPSFTAITAAQLARYNLGKYQYLLSQAQQEAVHHLSDHDEQLIGKLGESMLDHLTDRYDDLMDSIKPDSMIYGGKKYNPVNDMALIMKSPDSLLRKMGNLAYNKTYSDHAEIMAATLIDITRKKNQLAKVRGYTGAPQRIYARRLQLPEAGVKQMLEEMTKHAGVLQDYQRLQVQRVKQATGLTVVHSYDRSIPMGFTWQPLAYAQVKPLILSALAPLGQDYVKYFGRLLDPVNGELDIAGGPNRVTEFTSVGFPGVPESVYMKNFGGALSDVSHLIHEGGHAIHEQLMSDHLLVPSYKQGPNFLYEAYAMFNELLLLDALEKKEHTVKGKAFYTKQFLDKLSLEVFTSAEEGAFEQAIYDGVAAGTINDRKGVDSVYAGIMNKYDIFFKDEPQRRSEWINKRLVFDDPLYNVNYLYAMLVTCKLYQLQQADPKGFIANYAALLKNGFDAPAATVLKKFMGIDLNNMALLDGALKLMHDKTDALRQLSLTNP